MVTGGMWMCFFVISGFYYYYRKRNSKSFSFKAVLFEEESDESFLFLFFYWFALFLHFMFASDFEAFSRTLIHTIVSTNNIHLWINNKQYFAENSELIPLLHTWSLSVEEQFYFIWPAILLLLSKLKSITIRRMHFIDIGSLLSILHL
jgi:peptidoglycan/LPS O-acetylase OafA/YrhL